MEINPYALRVIRERSGLGVSDLARLAGLSQPHLSNMENGKRRTTPPTVRRLAEALQVPMLALLADPPGPPEIKEILALVEDRRESPATADADDAAAVSPSEPDRK